MRKKYKQYNILLKLADGQYTNINIITHNNINYIIDSTPIRIYDREQDNIIMTTKKHKTINVYQI